MNKILIFSLFFSFSAHAVPAEGHKIMIAGPTPWAVETARKVSAEGGNVVDVAVAVALTLSVTSPYYSSLGGGGFALVKMNGPVEALDFREMAPAKTGKSFYKDLNKEASRTGGQAVGVPGVPAGLVALHQKYGKLKWPQLFSEALRLAHDGFPVSGEWVRNTAREKPDFTGAGLKSFFRGEQELKPGELLKQPALEKALLALKAKGLKGFYEGPVAKDIASSDQKAGGVVSLEDLKNYKVRWLKPLTAKFENETIYLMPPPSSGGPILVTALKLMDKLKLQKYAALSVDEFHLLAEIESRAFRGRMLLGDPDFHQNPLEKLASDAYIDELAKSIDLKKATPTENLTEPDSKEKEETTHFSVMDNEGHAVALTQTLNGTYGSGVVTDQFHIALNDEMDDFTTRLGQPNMYGLIQGPGNQVEPGKRPLSSMSPTLVEKDGKIVMSLGAPGGPKIVTAVLQALYRVLAQDFNIDLAIQTPRVHHQVSPDKIFIDKQRFSPEILQGLRDRGHVIEEARGMAKVYIVRLRPDGVLEGAFDARGEGAAGGY